MEHYNVYEITIMNNKKSILLLAGVALLSLSACDSMGSEITPQEAEGMQTAIMKEKKEHPVRSYSLEITRNYNEKRSYPERNVSTKVSSRISISFDIDNCYARFFDSSVGTETTSADNSKTNGESTSEYTIFYKDGYLYSAVSAIIVGAIDASDGTTKAYSKVATTKESVRSFLEAICSTPYSLNYVMLLSASSFSTSEYTNYQTQTTFYSKGAGNISVVGTLSSTEMAEGFDTGNFNVSFNATFDDYVFSKGSSNIEATKKVSNATYEYKGNLTFKAKKSCSITLPDLNGYEETDGTITYVGTVIQASMSDTYNDDFWLNL